MPMLKVSEKHLVENKIHYSTLSTKEFVERLGLDYTKVTDIVSSSNSEHLFIYYEE